MREQNKDIVETKNKRMAEEEEPLSPMARLYQSWATDYGCIIMFGFKTKVDRNTIRDELKRNVSKHPRISSKPTNDGARWVKTEVNVEEHLFVPDFNHDEITANGETFVDDYISRLTTLPFDRSKPSWDIHILNIKTCDAEAVGILRYDHSLGDGMSLMSLIMASTQKTSDPESSPTIRILKRRENGQRNIGWFRRLIITSYSTFILSWNTCVDLLLLLATMLFWKDTKASLKGNANPKSNVTRFCHRIIPFDDIRFIKNIMNMTVNDVLLGVTQAALSRYLSGSHDKANEDGETYKLFGNSNSSDILLRASLMVNLRSEIGIQPLAKMLAKDSKCRWGNDFSLVVLPLSIGLETDPLAYLTKAKSTMDRKKNSLQASILYSIMGFGQKVFGAKIGALLHKRLEFNTTAIVSNLSGPMEEISFHGHPITYIAPSVYGHEQALAIHFLSYADKIVISIAVDPAVIPNPHKLCDQMEKSLKIIKVALMSHQTCNQTHYKSL